jgi:3-deoxy-D-manno-octulosonate 8-phosphate phosphatase (KDO 8-P phosphatase)
MSLNEMSHDLSERLAAVRCVIFDIDGVMTDCKLYLSEVDGELHELKAVNVRDGLGIKRLLKTGIEVAVISGRPSLAMEKRMAFLGVKHVWLNTEDKLPAYETLKARLGLEDRHMAMMGDDLPDVPLFQKVGLATCPKDAHVSVRRYVHWASEFNGGNGAIRELSDVLLQSQSQKQAQP